MEPQQLTDAQAEALNAAKQRGLAYSDIVQTDAFGYIRQYVEGQIQAFTNDALMGEGFKDYEEYRERRGQVNGLRNLLAEIQATVELVDQTTNGPSKA